jgi:flagellar hook-associated protein 1 FlgK
MVSYTQSIVNVMGDATSGLSTSLSGYFTSAQALSADPGSTDQRNSFLTASNALASQFSEVSGQLTSVGAQAQQDLTSSVQSVNTLTSQLALINGQMSDSPNVTGQSPMLLDQRDLLLHQLSSLTNITTSFSANGSVTVSMSNTITQNVVVDGQTAHPIGLAPGTNNAQGLVIDPYGNTQPLAGSSGGKIGGIQTFLSQVLQPAQENFNNLASTFVKSANAIQTSGIDANGLKGLPLFNLDATNPNAAAGITVNLSNPAQIATGAQFAAMQGASNVSKTAAQVSYVDPGAPAAALGNTQIQNNINPAYDKTLAINPTQGYVSVTSVAAGVTSPTFYLDNAQPGQQLQILTTDGRQLIGTPLSPNQQAQIITTANGFNKPVTYSSQYLNQSGQQGYQGLKVFYGAKADVLTTNTGSATGANVSSAVIGSSRIGAIGSTSNPVIAAGAITLDGVALGALTPSPGGLTASDVKNWLSIQPNTIVVPSGSLNFNNTLSINGAQISGFNDIKTLAQSINNSSGTTNVTATINSAGDLVLQGTTSSATSSIQIGVADNAVPTSITIDTSALNFTNSLTINGQTITGAYSDLSSLTDAINAQSSITNVSASVNRSGQLILTGTGSGSTSPIQIGDNSSNGSGNALGIADTTYSNSPGNTLGIANDTYPYTPNVSAQTYNQIDVPVNALNFTKTLSINGVEISGFSDLTSLIQAIQKKSATTNVSAAIGPLGGLVLQATPLASGLPIQIGTTDGTNTNALEIGNGTYNPMIQLIQKPVVDSGAPTLNTTFNSINASLGNSAAFNLNMTINGGASSLVQIPQSPATVKNIIDSINSTINSTSSLTGYQAVYDTNAKKIEIKNSSGTVVPSALGSYMNYPDLNSTFINQSNSLNNPSSFNINVTVSGNLQQEVSIPPNATTDDVINAINSAAAIPGSDLNGDRASMVNVGTATNPSYQIQIKNASGIALPSTIGLYQPSLELSFGANGQPSDLSKIGIRTAAYIEGPVPDNLAVFATGTGGTVQVGATYSGGPTDPALKLKTQTLTVKIQANNQYAVIDSKTGTELSVGTYDPNVSQPMIKYQGLSINLTQQPSAGDTFGISENQNAAGDNTNILQMVALSKAQMIGQSTFAGAYVQQTNTIGNQAQQAVMSQQALTAVNTQAKNAQDKVSGVSMNDMAAALIRFQQAYQAAAKTIQIASQDFTTINGLTAG